MIRSVNYAKSFQEKVHFEAWFGGGEGGGNPNVMMAEDQRLWVEAWGAMREE